MRLAPLSGSHQSAANRDKSFVSLIDQIRRHPLTAKVALGYTRRRASVHHARRGAVVPTIVGPTAVSFNVYGQGGGIQHLTAYSADPKGLADAFRHEQEAETMEVHAEQARANGAAHPDVPVVVLQDDRLPLYEGDEEPRIRDVDLAVRLGMKSPRDIRRLIKRNWEKLNQFNCVGCATQIHSGNNTEFTEYYLTHRQAQFIAVRSETPASDDVLMELVEVYDRYRKGTLTQPSTGQLGNDATLAVLVQIRDHLDGQNQQITAVKSDQSALVDMMSSFDARLQAVEKAEPPPVFAEAPEPIREPVYMTLAKWCRANNTEIGNFFALRGISRIIGNVARSRGIEIRVIERNGYRRNTYPDILLEEFADQIRNKVA